MPRSYHELPLKIQDKLRAHWEAASPREAVGLILEDQTIIPLKNHSRNEDRFIVSYFQVLKELGWKAFTKGKGIRYVFHSHLVNSYPSSTDKNFMAYLHDRWPGVGHLIYVPDCEYSIWQYGG